MTSVGELLFQGRGARFPAQGRLQTLHFLSL